MLLVTVATLSLTGRGGDSFEEPIAETSVPVMAELTEEVSVAVEPEYVEEIVVTSVQNDPAPVIDEAEHEMLACVIYQEAGGDEASDETRYMVGDVVLNRVADERFPNTIEEVLTQKQQYGRFYWTGIVWPERAKNPGEAAAVERAYRIAYDLLTDAHHSELYDNGYIWQAEFKQGHDIVFVDGTYFGK